MFLNMVEILNLRFSNCEQLNVSAQSGEQTFLHENFKPGNLQIKLEKISRFIIGKCHHLIKQLSSFERRLRSDTLKFKV